MIASERTSLTVGSYAQALFNAARKKDIVERIAEESKMLLTLLTDQPMFRHFLEGPQIPSWKKRELIDKAFKEKINPLLMNLLYIAIARERATLLIAMFQEFHEIEQRAQGVFPGKVTSARELDFDEKLRLKGALEKYTQCQLRLEYRVSPPLLGGIIFRFRDLLIDSSIRHGLDEIKKCFHGREAEAQ